MAPGALCLDRSVLTLLRASGCTSTSSTLTFHWPDTKRWVFQGFSKYTVIDYDEMFSLVVKLVMIRIVLSITASREWPIQ